MNRMRLKTAAALSVSAVLVLSTATVAGATAQVTSDRFEGEDRYVTATVLADSTFAEAPVVIIASGENFPDALAASYLAGVTDSPILLTRPGDVPAAVEQKLQEFGTSGIEIVGGPVAVSAAAEQELRDLGLEVDRLQGADRYETARRIATSAPATGIGNVDGKRTAILATGENFPDALAAGGISYAGGYPVVLTEGGSLNAHAAAALDSLGIEHVVIVGGENAVSATVAAQVAAGGMTTERVFGATRELTATALADWAVDHLNFQTGIVDLARSDDFADALAGAPHAGREFAPLLLADTPTSLGPAAADWLSDNSATVANIDVYGGPLAVSDGVVSEAKTAAGDTDGN